MSGNGKIERWSRLNVVRLTATVHPTKAYDGKRRIAVFAGMLPSAFRTFAIFLAKKMVRLAQVSDFMTRDKLSHPSKINFRAADANAFICSKPDWNNLPKDLVRGSASDGTFRKRFLWNRHA